METANGYDNCTHPPAPTQPGMTSPSYATVRKGDGQMNGGLANHSIAEVSTNQSGVFAVKAGTSSNGAYEDVE